MRCVRQPLRSNAILFAVTAAVWLAFDLVTKAAVDGYVPGKLIAGPFAGIFEFRLAHNTGGAWSLFNDSTLLLGFVSLLVCAVIVVYLFKIAPDSSRGMYFALGLVFAGGLGNAIDRFALGYVVDFIRPVFIDFPVFNIADIGVTCGIALFFILLLKEMLSPHAEGDGVYPEAPAKEPQCGMEAEDRDSAGKDGRDG